MSALGRKLRSAEAPEGRRLLFWCPACNGPHQVRVFGPGGGPRWEWDGDIERPTFKPSVLVTWRDPDGEFPDKICHFFVTAGQIQYCGDSTHAMSGQTVDLPDWPKQED